MLRQIIDIAHTADGRRILTLECGHYPETVLTNVQIGDSWHCYGCAFPHHQWTPVEALNMACHTYDRVPGGGTLYTISDIRHPILNGRQIFARMDHGKTVFEWKDD